jgi:hypothetical protein
MALFVWALDSIGVLAVAAPALAYICSATAVSLFTD